MRFRFDFHKHLAALLCLPLTCLVTANTWSAVGLPAMFTDHLVLQRDREVPVWGWADPGEQVTVSIADQTASTTADAQGQWRVKLAALPGGYTAHTLTVKASNTVTVNDVLVGEVWVCSGQSNMQWPVAASWNADLTIPTANNPHIRMITNENAGVQKSLQDFEGAWQLCTPDVTANFSAVGYFFGEQLQQRLDVPVGLIDNAWGGSACEAWVERDRLAAQEEQYGPLLRRWAEIEAQPDMRDPYAAYEAAILKWQADAIVAKRAGQAVPPQPQRPNIQMVQQNRPANLFHGRVAPIAPYAIRGVIWYQGESNAGRAYQYRQLFPLMIQNWRDAWQQEDLSFYWVQLADFRDELPKPAESDWAELREAQTMTLDALKHTGQAVIIDIGEASDIHPRNKLEVGKRLARLALAQDYGLDIVHQSPRYESLEVKDGKAILLFKHRGSGLRAVDKKEIVGFTIAGNDHQFHPAQAQIQDDGRISVWSDQVPQPVAVRYAWADNPVCNLFNNEGLPVTPFRTDDWPGVTANNR